MNSWFPFTTQQVKDTFGAKLSSGDDRAAAAQAQLFKEANDGHVKHYALATMSLHSQMA